MSSEWRVPLSDLDYGPDEEAAVLRVLRSKWISMGPEVQAFEREFASFHGVKHAFAVSSGTAALHLGIAALGIGEGDEVIQPALNFVASANMTVSCGATPVFADIIDASEPTIDPAEVERHVTDRTKAVVVMHYGGYPCQMGELAGICKARGIALIEDACHAVGAHYSDAHQRPPHGKMVGALGDVGCFSFFSNKNMAIGEGGMVTTDRDDVAERVRLLRSHGMTTLTWQRHKGHASSYDVLANGFNYRLDEIRAALGRVQLGKLQKNNAARGHLTHEYRRRLASLHGWVIPFKDYSGDSAYHLLAAVAPSAETRMHAAAVLKEAGIQTSLHYPCITTFQAFAGRSRGDVPKTQSFSTRILTLPLHPQMTLADVDTVTAELEKSAAATAVIA